MPFNVTSMTRLQKFFSYFNIKNAHHFLMKQNILVYKGLLNENDNSCITSINFSLIINLVSHTSMKYVSGVHLLKNFCKRIILDNIILILLPGL